MLAALVSSAEIVSLRFIWWYSKFNYHYNLNRRLSNLASKHVLCSQHVVL